MKHRFLYRMAACGTLFLIPGDATSTAPPGSTMFREISGEAGIHLIGRGRGSAWADLDEDGRLDLGVCLQQGGFHLYRNLGGLKFEEVTAARGLPELDSPFGIAMVDVDNDRDADLFITCGGYQNRVTPFEQENRLLLNDGHGMFTEVPDAAGLSLSGFNFSSSWCDVNNDGFLDVFICRVVDGHRKGDNRLFLNHGDLRFEDVTGSAGVHTYAFSQEALFFDADQDGDPDLFFTNRHAHNATTTAAMTHGTGPSLDMPPCSCPEGACACVDCRCHLPVRSEIQGADADPYPYIDYGNRLYLNRGDGTFTDFSKESGVMAYEAGFPAVAGDFDRDNDLDLFIGTFNYGTHAYFPGLPDHLFRNDGGAVFAEIGAQAGVASMGGPMGAAFMDFDNDGWLDLYVARGGPEVGRVESDKVYRNLGNGRFEEVARAMGIVNKGAGHGMTPADADNDGDLDIVVPAGQMQDSGLNPTLFFENMGNNGAWVSFVPEGEDGNRDAVNACLSIEAGGRTTFREIMAGGGFCSQAPLEAWFGLGDSEIVDRVTVIWRSGLRREGVNVAARRRIHVLRPATFDLMTEDVGATDLATGFAPVRFSWQDPRTGTAGGFNVQWWPAGALDATRGTLESKGPDAALQLAPGRYSWRVDLVDDLGVVSSSNSERTFEVAVAIAPQASPVWYGRPNPFRSDITFLNRPGTLSPPFSARVLDVNGRLVRSLESVDGGPVTWDGAGENGRPVSPGAYFVHVRSGDRGQVLKVIRVDTPIGH